ncbi:hypothetical protein [Spongiibacter tropicus]|uniref:hypothetical protein n=1 Tax=Spongiibacter tropicus TaxID=454602 RepID=UPI003A997367
MLRALLAFATLLLAACANQPLTHNYQGDVQMRSLTVDFQSLNELTESDDKDQRRINEVQRIFQAVSRALDEEASAAIDAQLRQFERIVVGGVREASGIPLMQAGESELVMVYGKDNELTAIRFEYPVVEGRAYMNLYGYLSYPSSDITRAGIGVLEQLVVRVTPKLALQVVGVNEADERFWNTSVSYKSEKEYVVSERYLLGVSMDGVSDGDIFLLPLGQGVVNALEKSLASPPAP